MEGGANWIDQRVVGMKISSPAKAPGTAIELGLSLAAKLTSAQTAQDVAKGMLVGMDATMIACYAGSFNPPTLGHANIIKRAQALVEELVVAVGHNPIKSSGMSIEKRMELLNAECAHFDNVRVQAYQGATVHYAKEIGAQVLIRGLRSYADFDHERGMAEINRRHGFETFFLVADTAHSNLSSTLVRQVMAAQLPLDGLVSPLWRKRY